MENSEPADAGTNPDANTDVHELIASGLTPLAGGRSFVLFGGISSADQIGEMIEQIAASMDSTDGGPGRAKGSSVGDANFDGMFASTRNAFSTRQRAAFEQLWSAALLQLRDIIVMAAREPSAESIVAFRRMAGITRAIQLYGLGRKEDCDRCLEIWEIPPVEKLSSTEVAVAMVKQIGGLDRNAQLARKLLVDAGELSSLGKALEQTSEVWIPKDLSEL